MTTEPIQILDFFEGEDTDVLKLEAVCSFKYLGVYLNNNPRSMFKDYNQKVVEKTKRYLTSVLSLSKAGPNRSELAYVLWNSVALPSILYGTEIIPLNECTLKILERCNTDVGKFILQLPKSSANVSIHIDAGLKPIRSVINERVLLYARSLIEKDKEYWPRIALNYNLSIGVKSPYSKLLNHYMDMAGTSLRSPNIIKKAVQKVSLEMITKMQNETAVTTFAMIHITQTT